MAAPLVSPVMGFTFPAVGRKRGGSVIHLAGTGGVTFNRSRSAVVAERLRLLSVSGNLVVGIL